MNQRRSAIRSLPPDVEKARAVQMADSLGLRIRMVSSDGRISEIRRLNPFGNPEYLTTHNSNAAKTVSTDKVKVNGGSGYDLSGNGIVVGLWDGGVFRDTHVEFEDRGIVIDESADVVGHATHVAGTIGARGIDAKAEGMSPAAILEGYHWDSDLIEMDMAAGEGLLLSNHSYGFVVGWDYNDNNSDEARWEWYGELNVSEEEEFLFGFYHREAHDYDRIAYKNPHYLIVKSAGNDRGEGPSPGAEHYVWENGDWQSSTEVRQKDGGDDGFDSMGPVSTAKNILAVGAIRDLPLGYTSPENVMLTSFSAFGPTDDGRVKPDLVANGDVLYSSYSGSDTDYRNSSGTSMSAPNVTGSLALIQQHHYNMHDSYLTSAALKGLVLHTADEAGNPGPDYKFGWGVLNTLSAVDLISDGSFDRIREDSIGEGEEYRVWLYSNGTDPVKVTICWTDPRGIVPESALDPVTRILVNDLDLRLEREIDGYEFQPFILDPLHPDDPAVSGDNLVDNVEQVFIQSPQKGFYELIVSHKETLANDGQNFAMIISGLTDEFFATG
ncbi:MAG: S8 family serine peptidase, partial [Bacteroidales bacterium]|nr:S8 family serine peptidase [Bacteroidales bacterium]